MCFRAVLLRATAAWLFSFGLACGGGLDGGFAGGPLTGAGGFTPLQRGFGSPGGPWLSGGPEQFGRSQPGFLPRYPDRRGRGWRRRPYGYGVGLVYPYVDDSGEEFIEEEQPAPQRPPPAPPAPPKPSAGPKTVSAPPASVAPVSSSPKKGGPVHCGAGRKMTVSGASNGGVGCISP